MKKIGVFPGSFDPITLGHECVIKKAIPLFDEIIIAIGENSTKNYMFSLEERIKWIENTFKEYSNVTVKTYKGLTVDFCKEHKSEFIIRGIRNASDFEFENGIAQVNREITGIETLFFIADSNVSYISSSIVRDVFKNGGIIDKLVPDSVKPM